MAIIDIPMGKDSKTSGILSLPESFAQTRPQGIVMAHGAANDMNNPLIQTMADRLTQRGFACLRFNFLYRELGKKSVDPEHLLVLAWQNAVTCLCQETGLTRFIAMGKSLGARIAAQATAAGDIQPERLIFLGYPLHAPGKKDRLKDAPLLGIHHPMLFFQGTRDPFCDLDVLGNVIDKLPATTMLEIIENGDHSLALPKSDPRHQDEIYEQIINACVQWI